MKDIGVDQVARVKMLAARRRWHSLLAFAFLSLGVAVVIVIGTPARPAVAESCGKIWTGPPGGDWNTAANWSGAVVPGPTDRVCINAGDSPVFSNSTYAVLGVDDAGTLTISGGTLQLTDTAQASTFNVLNITGGNFVGPADSTISGAVHWTSGAMLGTGSVMFASGASLAISGPSGKFLEDSRTLSLLSGSSATWTDAGPIVTSNSGASASINNAGTFTIQGDSFWYRTCAPCTPAFNNSGTLIKNSTTGQTRIDPQFNNSGTVQAQTGTLTLTGGDGGSESGTFSPSTGATIEFGGGNYILGGNMTGAGTVLVSAGNVDVSGSYNVGFNLTSGTTNFNSSGTLTSLGLSSNAVLSGSGTATVSGTATWTGATMRGTGTLAFASGASLAIPGPSGKFLEDSRAISLLSGSSATWTGTGPIQTSNSGASASINNAGTFTIQGDSFWYRTCAPCTPAFNNSGTLIKNSTTGQTRIDPQFNNTGTVQVTRGVLTLNGGYSPGAGSITRVNIGGTTAQTQFGVLDIPSAVTLQGTLDVVTDAPFVPALGQQFRVLTYSSHTGTLANGNGRVVDSGLYYRQHYDDLLPMPSSLTLRVEGRLTSTAVSSITRPEPTLSDTTVVANFRDNEEEAAEPPAQYSANLTWPDGTTSSGRVVSDGTGGFNVLPELGGHQIDDPGGSISVAISDNDIDGTVSAAVSASTSMTVTEVAISGTGGFTVTGSEGTPAAAQTVATFTDPGGPEVLSDYAATIAWGDGQTSAGTISYDSVSHLFTVVGAHTYAEDSAPSISVTITHDTAPTLVVNSSASITDPAVTATGGFTVTGSENTATATQTVATFTDPGGAEALADYGATIAWGDTQSSAGTISLNAGTLTVSGSHTYAEEGSPNITVTLTHDTAPSAVVQSSASIADPAVAGAGGFTVNGSEGTATTAQAVATFTDPAGPEAITDYASSIAWGDGQTSAGSISYNAASQVFTVSGAHTYAVEGNSSISVTLTHDSSAAVVVPSTASIADPAVLATGGSTVNGSEGTATAAQTVATFSDPGGAEALADYGASIAWGDGLTSAGAITYDPNTNLFTASGAHTYAEEGTPTITVTLSHDSAPAVALSSSASIADPGVAATGGFTLGGSEGTATTAQTVATFSDPSGAEALGDYGASIAWGDGQSSTGSITYDPNTHLFTVSGAHTFAEEGNPAITVTLTHDSTPVVVVSSSAGITDQPAAASGGFTVTGNAGTSTTSQTVATFSDPAGAETPADYSATIDWGDGLSSAGSINYDPVSRLFTVSGAHAYAASGHYTIAVTISHGSASSSLVYSSADITGTIKNTTSVVTNASPSIPVGGSISDTATLAGGASPTGTIAFKLFGPNDASCATVIFSSTKSVNGNGNYNSNAFMTSSAGTYQWVASYSGDASNTASGGSCGDAGESVAVTKAPVGLATKASASVSEGGSISDTAAVSGGVTPTGSLTFSLFGANNPSCSGSSVFSSTKTITGDGSYPSDAFSGAEEGVYRWLVTYSGDASNSSATTACGDANESVSVTDLDQLAGTAAPVSPIEAKTFAGTVANFTDTNNAATAADFTATVAWGDGNTSTGSVSGGSGKFAVSGSHLYDEGGFTFKVTLTDDSGGSSLTVTRAFNVPEADVLSGVMTSISATEGTVFSGHVATFTDKNSANVPADFSATIAWGDGSTNPGIVSGGNGTFTISGNHTYQEGGAYPVRVTLKDNSPGTAQAAASRRILVADYQLTATGTSLTEHHGSSFSAIVATLSDADPSCTATNYVVRIDWGDGSVSTATVTGANPFSVHGTHRYSAAGVYTATVYIIDNGLATATTTTSVTVS